VRHLASRGIAVDAEAFARATGARWRGSRDSVVPDSVIVAAVEHGQRATVEWLCSTAPRIRRSYRDRQPRMPGGRTAARAGRVTGALTTRTA
jgi:hypothetical protein